MTNNESVCKISKMGKWLYAKIPMKDMDKFSIRDKVKVVLLEKADKPDIEKVKKDMEGYLKNPNGDRLKGTIMGHGVEISMAKIIEMLPKNQAKKIIENSLVN